jgi:hypothetical protein
VVGDRRDGFVPRVLAYHASRDLVPLYSVYALLFADHGVGSAEISLLFIIWADFEPSSVLQAKSQQSRTN